MNTDDKKMIENIIGALIGTSIAMGGDYKEEIAWLRSIKKITKKSSVKKRFEF